MEKSTKKKKHFWQRTSLFTTTFLLLSAMCLATSVIMYAFVNWVAARDQTKRIHDLNVSQLQRVGEEIDTRFEMLEQNISQVLNSNDSISVMVNPFQTDSDRSLRIVSVLSSCVAQNSLVREAFLYLPTSDEVYSSSRNFVERGNFSYADEIDHYLKTREEGRDGSLDTVMRINYMDGELFAVGDFCVPNFIGALFFEIDLDNLFLALQGMEEDSVNHYLILDEEGTSIVGDAEVMENASQAIAETRYEDIGGENGEEKRTGSVFRCQSKTSGLQYVLYVDPNAAFIDYASIVWMILPFLFLYAALAEFYSLYITRKIYRPINRLMQVTMEKRQDLREDEGEEPRNELEFLEEAFLDTLEENTQHRELLASISHDVAEQTFRSVLNGRDVDDEYVVNTLQGIGMGAYLKGRYMAMAGRLVLEKNRELSSVEIGLYRRSIVSLMEELGGADYVITAFFLDRENMAVILCFKEDSSVISMKHCVADCLDTVERFTENLPYSLVFGKGKVYEDIVSLRLSWQEALEELQYLTYMAEEPEGRPADPSPETYDRSYFADRGQKVAEAAEKESRENAEKEAGAMVREILESDPAERRECFEAVIDAMVEKMIDSHITSEEIDAIGGSQILDRVTALSDEGEIQALMEDFFSQAIRVLQNSSRRNRYRYVDEAKEYIGNHYSDGNLSLLEVADFIGISAPYLSGVFNEINKGSFSSYLKTYRVTQARNFLEQTTLNVAEIGYKCGFNSAQSFSRAFKKETGYSPGRYRELRMEQKSDEKKEKGNV